MQNLFIVESPAKAKTIEKYLGKNYKVVASMGHVRDLPKSEFAVDIEHNFKPRYISIRGKSDVIKSLKKDAKNSDMVYLATDPDREGEAISWHLCTLLGLDDSKYRRVVFNEITKSAVKEAVKHPRKIDQNLVDAQQARRVLDRIVGYKLSPFLWRKVKKGLSAGRVQSVATAMVIDRENEIRAFKPKEYWLLTATFENLSNSEQFPAKFYGTAKGPVEVTNEKQATEIYNAVQNASFSVTDVKRGVKKRKPSAPFITSTLQQEASRRYNFQTKRTMKAAQELYEGINIKGVGLVGLITYMRTDSLRISDEFALAAKDYIIETYGADYYPEKRRIYKTKKSAQDAHEAIRPTNMNLNPATIKDSLTSDQYRIYKLVFDRFVASQMSDAVYDTLTADILGAEYIFKASCQSLKFKGFTAAYKDSDTDEKTERKLYQIEKDDPLKLIELDKEQNFTQPPARYTEGTLTKALEENGVGRPSTFVPIITTILQREYVERDGKVLKPTVLGEVTTKLMKDYFGKFVDYGFSANLETQLDEIQEGKVPWQTIISKFYDTFESTLESAEESLKETRIKVPDEVTDEVCPNCGRNLVVKKSKYGKFLACPGYPECKFTKTLIIDTGVPCPKCGGRIIKRKSKTGKTFYSCENLPKCDYMTWDEPLKKVCDKCGSHLFRKSGKFRTIYCPNPNCPGAKKPTEQTKDKENE